MELTLPGAWQQRPEEEPTRWHFRSADKREELTLSRHDPIDSEETELPRAAARQRHAVELSFRRAGVEMTEASPRTWGGFPAWGFSGSSGGQHCFHALVVWVEGSLWTLFYQSYRITEEAAAERAEAIFGSIRTARLFR